MVELKMFGWISNLEYSRKLPQPGLITIVLKRTTAQQSIVINYLGLYIATTYN